MTEIAGVVAAVAALSAAAGARDLSRSRERASSHRPRRARFSGSHGRVRWPRVALIAASGRRSLGFFASVGGRLLPTRSPRLRAGIEARLESAGLAGAVRVHDVIGIKVGMAICAALVVVPLTARAPGHTAPLIAVALPVAGFLTPDLWLGRRARARAAAIVAALPDHLDLLRASVTAGTSLEHSLRLVGERAGGPLAEELATMVAETGVGIPFVVALDGLAARVPVPEVRRLVAALQHAHRFGAGLAEVLAGQARDARAAANRRIEERAARAAPQIQLVVAMVLVPSTLLMFGAVVLAAVLRGDLRVL